MVVVGIAIVVFLVVMTVLAPFIAPHDPTALSVGPADSAPSLRVPDGHQQTRAGYLQQDDSRWCYDDGGRSPLGVHVFPDRRTARPLAGYSRRTDRQQPLPAYGLPLRLPWAGPRDSNSSGPGPRRRQSSHSHSSGVHSDVLQGRPEPGLDREGASVRRGSEGGGGRDLERALQADTAKRAAFGRRGSVYQHRRFCHHRGGSHLPGSRA